LVAMKKPKKPVVQNQETLSEKEDSIELEALKKRIKLLEKELDEARFREEAFRTLIHVAKEELNIDILKKSVTKQSGK
jgi:hypothetical protein